MNNTFKNKFSNFIDKINQNKKIRYVIIAILFLIILFIVLGNNNTKESATLNNYSVDTYVTNLENKLTKTLSKVKGAGKVMVVITVESGMETVLASKITTTENAGIIETIETPIIVNGKPIILKEMYPEIIGVLIVSEGATNIAVMNRLQQATVSLLDININQIEILSMS